VIYPLGGKRGQQVSLELMGRNLDKPKMSMMLDGPMGKRDVMAATSKGVSNARSFEVGDLTGTFETEPNDGVAKAHADDDADRDQWQDQSGRGMWIASR
jgi:hypothetical protein